MTKKLTYHHEGVNFLKELVYLDTSFIHSFIAQNNDGLPTNISREMNEEVSESKELEQGFKSGSFIEGKFTVGEFEIPLLFKSPSGGLVSRVQPGNFSSEKITLSQLESGREIISKQLHDNALSQFEKYLTDKNLAKDISDNPKPGDYIKVTSSFKIIDFKYLQTVLDPDSLIEFAFNESEEGLKKLKEEISNIKNSKEKQVRLAELRHIENELKNAKSSMKKQFDFLIKALSYLSKILPTDSFVLMNKIISPLKNEYLREKPQELLFKYGGGTSSIEVTLIGKVTKEITKTKMPDLNSVDALYEFPSVVNAVLHEISLINTGDFIVSPIAIYFE
jgi:hypothetical protein